MAAVSRPSPPRTVAAIFVALLFMALASLICYSVLAITILCFLGMDSQRQSTRPAGAQSPLPKVPWTPRHRGRGPRPNVPGQAAREDLPPGRLPYLAAGESRRGRGICH